jgi:prephenate dehydrogenase
MSKIAFLGTGLLGSGFVKGLRSKGHDVVTWNRTAGKAQELVALGATVAATPGEAVAGADRVHLCLSADAAVDAVLEAVLPAIGRATPLLDHSTTAPKLTAARGARLAAAGQAFLHAPVFMSPAAAAKGVGIMLCSGPRALFDEVQAEVATMTGELWFGLPARRRPQAARQLDAVLDRLGAGRRLHHRRRLRPLARRRDGGAGQAQAGRRARGARQEDGRGGLHGQLRAHDGAQGHGADARRGG